MILFVFEICVSEFGMIFENGEWKTSLVLIKAQRKNISINEPRLMKVSNWPDFPLIY